MSQVWTVPYVDTKVSPAIDLACDISGLRGQKRGSVYGEECCEEHFKKNKSLFFHNRSVNKWKI